MNNQIQIVKPDFPTGQSIQDVKKERKILAKDLLEEFEAIQVQKQGIMFAVSVEGILYLVRPQDKVPKNTKVVKIPSTNLMGIGAVAGG